MDSFSMRGAWSFGFRFFAHRTAIHLMVLIGMGLILPVALQYALGGGVLGTSNPVVLDQSNIAPPGRTAGVVAALAIVLTYLLQLSSYFMSWRLGFGRDAPLGGTVLFGLGAGLLAMAIFLVIGVPAMFGAQAIGSSGVPFLGLLIVLIPLVTIFALFYTLPAALLATIASILLVSTMVLGTVTGNVGMAALMLGGGSGAVVVLFLVMSVALIWLAARFSCTTSVMAERKSWNLIAAMRESWALTLEDQWVILRYLAFVSFGLAVLLIAAVVVAGMGAVAFFQGGAGLGGGGAGLAGQIAGIALALIIGVPLVLLTVLLPAGIYRELTRSSLAAEVFA
jgi:hypothetical protein